MKWYQWESWLTFWKGLSFISCMVLFLAACSQPNLAPPPDTLEPLVFGTSSTDSANGVASYANSYAYVVGTTSGSLDGPNLGSSDIVVRKYGTTSPTPIWRTQFGSPAADSAADVAVDGNGNAYVLGQTSGTIAGSSGGQDIVLRKYNSSGAVIWTRQFGTPGTDRAGGVAVDANGYVYVVGTAAGLLPGASRWFGFDDAFLRKYTSGGSIVWTRQFGTSARDWANSVSVSSTGYVHVAGGTRGSLPGGRTLVGSYDAFVRQYNSYGVARWTRQFGFSSEHYDNAEDVRVDWSGNVYATGSHYATDGSLDIFLIKYNSGGGLLWSRTAGPTNSGASWYSGANGLAVDRYGNAYLTGFTNGIFNGPSAGGIDVFIHKYSNSGSLFWSRQFGTAQYDVGLEIDTTTTGSSIYVVGGTDGALVGANDGDYDGFVRRLNSLGNTVWTDQ